MKHSESAHNQGKNSNLKGLKLVRDCPLCSGEYELNDLSILQEDSGVYLIHATCPHCCNSIMSIMIVSESGLSSVGLVTDLNRKDVVRLKNKKPITDNELLEFHSLIQSKNNSLFKSLSKITDKNII